MTAIAKVNCDWIVNFAKERRHTVNKRITTTFVAQSVPRRTRIPLVVTCVVRAAAARQQATAPARGSARQSDLQAIAVRVPPNTHVETPVIVDPGTIVQPPHQGGGGLPSTGGPKFWLLLAGLGALLVGSASVRSGRRPVAPSGA